LEARLEDPKLLVPPSYEKQHCTRKKSSQLNSILQSQIKIIPINNTFKMASHPSRAHHDPKDAHITDVGFAAKEKTAVDTIRALAMDGVQKANSGHPGTPMAMAPVAYTIWTKFLRFDPEDPIWPNRDRFVLSMGHASMLIYSTLHLAGVREVRLLYVKSCYF
jgi:hypothetical protein